MVVEMPRQGSSDGVADTHLRVEGDPTLVQVGRATFLPSLVDVRSLHDSEWPFTVDVLLTFDISTMVYQITLLQMRVVPGPGVVITGMDIRKLAIKKVHEKVFTADFPIWLDRTLSSVARFDESIGAVGDGAEKLRPTPDVLEAVAETYTTYHAIHSNPTQAIARIMQIPPRTASHWVGLARQRGFLSADTSRSLDEPRAILYGVQALWEAGEPGDGAESE